MFYFSINKRALGKIKREAKKTDREIIGVLIGRVYDNLLVVTSAESGEQASGITRVKLSNSTIAKIVDKIMAGKIEGNILGWYHSHPGFGVFMSPTDVGTQVLLQQFSKKVAALVIDPKEDKYGVFTLDSDSGVQRIPDEQIYLFKDGEDGIPDKLKKSHRFEAKLEILPVNAVDKIRYVIECTAPHWPDKKCAICGSELKFNEKEQIWYCPETAPIIQPGLKDLVAADVKIQTPANEKIKFQTVHYTCKKCEIPLKFSKKLDAWYCNKCRRVYKHRVKKKDGETIELPWDKTDEEQLLPDKAITASGNDSTEVAKPEDAPSGGEVVTVEALEITETDIIADQSEDLDDDNSKPDDRPADEPDGALQVEPEEPEVGQSTNQVEKLDISKRTSATRKKPKRKMHRKKVKKEKNNL